VQRDCALRRGAGQSQRIAAALPEMMRVVREAGMDLCGAFVSLDGVHDCRANRKATSNRGMVLNINPNPRGRKQSKRGRKPIFERTPPGAAAFIDFDWRVSFE
jgi:hypothetical protein